MSKWNEARTFYENTPIPGQLESRVREGIHQGQAAHRRRTKRRRLWLSTAACFMVLAAGLNLSPTIAHAAAEVPVLGRLFQILTLTDYEKTEDSVNYSVAVPQLDAHGELAETVNAAIQSKVEQHMEQARQDWADYEEAFFATGGTEADWAGREMDVTVDYEVKFQTDTQVSFVVCLTEGWVTAREERYYYNLDLANEQTITLQALLGEDWIALSNRAIQTQIDEQTPEMRTLFFAPGDGGFTTVDETTAFYIRGDGVPVAVFPPYSIAAGAAGFLEFPLAPLS